jgi:two-component system nitrogen regulation sensor histidine kinase GlnL
MVIEDDYDPSLPPTWGDPDQLQQVFLNLLKNAAEAGREGGTIRIRTFYEQSLKVRRRDGTGGAVPLQVEIIDDGPGIPPDIAADIFEPFVSGRENGTGLGLALISKIISDHDGWIAVDSVPGPHRVPHFPTRRAARGQPMTSWRRPDDRSILTWTVPFSSPMTTARSARF